MVGMDYSKWSRYVEKLFMHYGLKPKTIVDLACGTGGITIPMALKGYDIMGIDISEDMLFEAKEKARKLGLKIPFVCQDMRSLDLHHPVEAIICLCDGFNYLLDDEDMDEALSSIYRNLK
jgi:ubiquinone/menaquinone biosynthesis C-methylase UbiE